MKPIRVIHLPSTVGGNPQGLSLHLRKLGLDSTSLALTSNHFNYPTDMVLWKPGDSILARETKRIWTLFRVLRSYDIIHLNFGTTLFAPVFPYKQNFNRMTHVLRMVHFYYTWMCQWLELESYRTLQKPVFVHYQGDDARQGDYSLEHFEYSIAQQVDDTYYNKQTDDIKRKSIKRLAKYCDQIYAVNPDLLHVLPERSRFIPYSHISLEEWKPVFTQSDPGRPIRIGHAPSNRKVKGTDLIISALDELKSEGYSFQFVLVEALSNEEARKHYESIDVLVDQLFAGWYGGLAVEAMALGKPVLVYIREGDLKFIPAEMKEDLPFIQVNPDTIKSGLRSVMEMPRPELMALAKRSREYVEKWHDPVKIAGEIRNDYVSALRRRGKVGGSALDSGAVVI